MIPEDYFYILSNLDIEEPHILSLASRKCWDQTWSIVEHDKLQSLSIVNLDNSNYKEEYFPFRYFDRINQQQLNEFNNKDQSFTEKDVELRYRELLVDHILTTLINEDLIKTDFDDDGQITYQITKKGKKYVDKMP